MIFHIYSVYDPEVESFDSRITCGPLAPDQQKIQYERAFIKMNEQDKAFMEGKIAMYLGTFDDETGEISQTSINQVFHFKKPKKESQVVEENVEAPKDA